MDHFQYHTQILRAMLGLVGAGTETGLVYGGELSNRDGGAHAMMHVLSVTER